MMFQTSLIDRVFLYKGALADACFPRERLILKTRARVQNEHVASHGIGIYDGLIGRARLKIDP